MAEEGGSGCAANTAEGRVVTDMGCGAIHRERVGSTANLNYWAYWVGEIDEPKVSDTFMVETSPESWYGTKLLQHLIERLSAEFGFVELNVHTLWALVRRKPGVLDGDPALLREVAARSESLRDEEVSPQARRELDAVLYAVAMKRGR